MNSTERHSIEVVAAIAVFFGVLAVVAIATVGIGVAAIVAVGGFAIVAIMVPFVFLIVEEEELPWQRESLRR